MMKRWILASTLIAGLTACGQDDGATEKPAAGVATNGWNAMDACAMLDVGKLSALTGHAFATANLRPIAPMTSSTAATSMCEFSGPAGAMASLLAREAPYDDATPEALERARNANGLAEPAELVPGLGKAAFWRAAPVAKTLQVFYDERRSVVVTLVGREASLGQASAIARAVAP